MNTRLHIGDEIKEWIGNQKRSVAWLAEEIGYDPSDLRKLLNHGRINPKILRAISDVTGIDFIAHNLEKYADLQHYAIYHPKIW